MVSVPTDDTRYKISTELLNSYLLTVMESHGDDDRFLSIVIDQQRDMSQQLSTSLVSMFDGLQSRQNSQQIANSHPGEDTGHLYEKIEQSRRSAVNNPATVANIENFSRASSAISQELFAEQLHEQKLIEKLGLIKEGLEYLISRGLREISFDTNPETVSHFDLPPTIGNRVMELVAFEREYGIDLRYGEPKMGTEEPSFGMG